MLPLGRSVDGTVDGGSRPSAGFAAKMSNQVYLSMLAPSTRGMHQSAVTAAATAAAAAAPALQYIAAPLPHTRRVHTFIRNVGLFRPAEFYT